MTRLPSIDRKVIDLISRDLEEKTDELTAAQDKEIDEADKSMLYSMEQMNSIVLAIRTRYHKLYMAYLKAMWDELSYDEQIIFAKYYHSRSAIEGWMDECQITALKLLA